MFNDDTAYGIIPRLAPAASPEDCAHRTALVDRHLRAALCRDGDGTFRAPDYVNAVELVNCIIDTESELGALIIVISANESLSPEHRLSQDQKSRWFKGVTKTQLDALRAHILGSIHRLHAHTACERDHGVERYTARDATIVHHEAMLSQETRRQSAFRNTDRPNPKRKVPELSVIRFAGKGDLEALDAKLCTRVPAAIERTVTGPNRFEIQPDRAGRYTVHVYDQRHLRLAREMIAGAGFRNVD